MTTKKRRKPTRKAGNKRPIPGWIFLVIGLLSGLLLAVFANIYGWIPQAAETDKPPAVETEKVADATQKPKAQPKIRKDDYDFYQTLPMTKVEIPKEELQNQQLRQAKKYNYTLQLASFKQAADAEALKAQLAFTGQVAQVKKVELNDSTHYRVQIGPFTSARKAEVQKKRLQKSGYNALIIKRLKAN